MGYECNNLCRARCADSADCASDYHCTSDHVCVPRSQCTSDLPCGGYTCDLGDGECRYSCVDSASHCTIGYECVDEQCRPL